MKYLQKVPTAGFFPERRNLCMSRKFWVFAILLSGGSGIGNSRWPCLRYEYDRRKILAGGQRMAIAKVPNGVGTLPKISTGWVWRTNVTDDKQTRRQTDGRRNNSDVQSRSLIKWSTRTPLGARATKWHQEGSISLTYFMVLLTLRWGDVMLVFVDSQPSTDVLTVFQRHSDVTFGIWNDFSLSAS